MAVDPILRIYAETAVKLGILEAGEAARIAAHAQTHGITFVEAINEMALLNPEQLVELEQAVAASGAIEPVAAPGPGEPPQVQEQPVPTDPMAEQAGEIEFTPEYPPEQEPIDFAPSLEQQPEPALLDESPSGEMPISESEKAASDAGWAPDVPPASDAVDGVAAAKESEPGQVPEGGSEAVTVIPVPPTASKPDLIEEPVPHPASGGVPFVPSTTAFWSFHDRVVTRSKIDDRYDNQKELERHGRLRIVTVEDTDFHRTVLMKRLVPAQDLSPEVAESFLHEALITGQLEHPNVVPAYDVGILSNGELFFTTKLARGRSLADVLGGIRMGSRAIKRTYTTHKLLTIFEAVCRGVAYAHAHGIVHRNLRPDHVMIGEFGEVFVTEWGKGCILGEPDKRRAACEIVIDGQAGVVKTGEGEVIGAPAYLPPEQVAGNIDAMDNRSDIYSLGAILYEVLTLNKPITAASSVQVVQRILDSEPVKPSAAAGVRDIPPELEAIVLKAMAKKPENRYLSAEEFRSEIEMFLAGRITLASSYGLGELLTQWIKDHIRVAALTVFIILVFLGSAAGVLWWAISSRNKAATSLESFSKTHESTRRSLQNARKQLESAANTQEGVTAELARLYVERGAALIDSGKVEDGILSLAAATRFREDLSLMIKAGWEYAVRPVPHLRMQDPFERTDDHEFLVGTGAGLDVLDLEDMSGQLHRVDLWTGKRWKVTAVAPNSKMISSPDGKYVLKVFSDKSGSTHVVVQDTFNQRILVDKVGNNGFFAGTGSHVLVVNGVVDMMWFALPDGTEIWRKKSPGIKLRGFKATPNVRFGAFLFANEIISIRDLATGEEIRKITPEVIDVHSIHIGSTGRQLAIVYGGGGLRMVGLPSGGAGDFLSGSGPPDFSVRANGRFLILGRSDGVWFWDLEKGKRIELPYGNSVESPLIALAPGGSRAAVAVEGGFDVWDLSQAVQIMPAVEFRKRVEAIAFSADGGLVVAKVGEKQFVYNLSTGIRYELVGRRAGFTPANPGHFWLERGGTRGFSVWSTSQFAKGLTTPGNYRKLWGFAPGGRCAILWTARDTKLWNPRTGREYTFDGLCTVESDTPPSLTLLARRFPVGPRTIPGDDPFAAAGGDFRLQFFGGGRYMLARKPGKQQLIDLEKDSAVAEIKPGSVIAVSGDARQIAVIDSRSGTGEVRTVDGNKSSQLSDLVGALAAVFSSSGDRLVVSTAFTAGRFVTCVDTSRNSLVSRLPWPLDTSLAFSADLRRMVRRSEKNRRQIEMLTVDGGSRLAQLEDAGGDIWGVYLAPDGSSALLLITDKTGVSYPATWAPGESVAQLLHLSKLDVDATVARPVKNGEWVMFLSKRGLAVYSFKERQFIINEMIADTGERYMDARISPDGNWLYLQVSTSAGMKLRLCSLPDCNVATELSLPQTGFIMPARDNLRILAFTKEGKAVCYDLAKEFKDFTGMAVKSGMQKAKSR
ncbi:MAG: hypothetical protein E3J72_13590 [Planctomycetota bacterium]|nr:MAG: hypothetical protein E3J72_13590 [Planctomycetota bacterium]